MSDYLYESSTDNLIRTKCSKFKKHFPILKNKKPCRKSLKGKCFSLIYFVIKIFKYYLDQIVKHNIHLYRMKLIKVDVNFNFIKST